LLTARLGGDAGSAAMNGKRSFPHGQTAVNAHIAVDIYYSKDSMILQRYIRSLPRNGQNETNV
jgi:hypothetical protein